MFKTKCPKCGSKNVNTVKEGLVDDVKRNLMNVAFPIRIILGTGKKPKPLYVCTDCSFSWKKP